MVCGRMTLALIYNFQLFNYPIEYSISIHSQPHPLGETYPMARVGGLFLFVNEKATAKYNDNNLLLSC
ncbi:hypothetical protein CRENPOLYSF2_2300016 [Crenothrix polyspora]|uniref:Uncharacterized protein n=1 Tax=Crenothrix polyspora TaxID=360316 RepID=A0A1R4H5S5_9GAMM|nr:hypothetical protein CRENPOLYSF2_2300016 [Crenothrix polyspora]